MEPSPRIYRIIRFRFNGTPRAVRGMQYMTLAECREYCSRPDTRGKGWFCGYDYMKGVRPELKGE